MVRPCQPSYSRAQVLTRRLVSSLFDFSSAGQGTFTFEPVTNFRVATPEASIISESQMDRVEASAESIDVFVSGDLAKRELHERNKRAVNICTNASRKSFIDSRHVLLIAEVSKRLLNVLQLH